MSIYFFRNIVQIIVNTRNFCYYFLGNLRVQNIVSTTFLRIAMKLNENMYYLRLMHQYSISHLAKLVGYSPNTLANWERGDISPNADAVEKLCEIYEISPNQIFGWEKCEDLESFLAERRQLIEDLNDLKKQKASIEKRIKALK